MIIDNFLKNVDSVCITGHIRPDGDCAGSNLALYLYITKYFPNIKCDIFLEKATSKLAFLPGFEMIGKIPEDKFSYDLMFCLDAASLERIGDSVKYFHEAKKTVNIDHHVSDEGFCNENYIEPNASSTCEVLYKMLDKEKINKDIALCLYTGIVYDTGVFKYATTSPETMRIAASLMEYDLPIQYVIDESFYAKTFDENRIYGYAILNSKLAFDGKVIYSYITREKLTEFGVSSKELEGIVSQLRLTKGVECAIFAYDLHGGEIKVSLRSYNYLDVNRVAMAFGGGGHIRASGCNMTGNIHDCLEKVLGEVEKYI